MIQVLVAIVLFQQEHRFLVLLGGLLSAQHTQVVGIQYNEGEARVRAEVVGVDVAAALCQAPPGVRTAVELRAQEPSPVEVVELVVPPHVMHLRRARAELLEHHLQRLLGGFVAPIEAVYDVTQLQDEVRRDSRLGPTLERLSHELDTVAVVALPCSEEVVSVVNVRVLDVSDYAEAKQRRWSRTVGHTRRYIRRVQSVKVRVVRLLRLRIRNLAIAYGY